MGVANRGSSLSVGVDKIMTTFSSRTFVFWRVEQPFGKVEVGHWTAKRILASALLFLLGQRSLLILCVDLYVRSLTISLCYLLIAEREQYC